MKFIYKLSFLVTFVLYSITSFSTEGMWIPTLLKAVESDMQAMGLELSAEDIYSINNSSLKDAIVHFGGGCTAELISGEGLLLTNHHCGYSQIQSHSSLENNYLRDGFWAMDRTSELKNDGLTATLIDRIDDVSKEMMFGITAKMTVEEIEMKKSENQKTLEEKYTKDGLEGSVRAYNYGNSYFIIVTKTYKDVRLVGAPPSAVGKFGGDTDNWVWPRHTGDFSIFRIYADSNNEPAEYSETNVPYKPKQHLKVSLDGVEEGDFTMVFGFPGRTFQFLTSDAVEYVTNTSNPMRIKMRDESLNVIDAAMRADEKTKIQYASKQSSISNAWKKWKGQNMGLARMGALQRKKDIEAEFTKLIGEKGLKKYSSVLADLKTLQSENQSYQKARELYIEYFYYGPEIVSFAQDISSYANDITEAEDDDAKKAIKEKYKKIVNNYFDDYNVNVDMDIFKVLTPLYSKYLDDHLEPAILAQGKSGWSEFTKQIYKNKVLTNRSACLEFIEAASKGKIKKYNKSLAAKLSSQIVNVFYEKALPNYRKNSKAIDANMKIYVEGLMAVFPEKSFWADANSTLRLTYGKAEGSEPRDGMAYKFYTTAEGILSKHSTGLKDYEMPEDLISLLEKRDYGVYAHSDGELRICFTGSNHTTGGNSGSPALNGKGHLVGLNFDRSWESTMSDIMFDPEQCRNIMVDVRYILWMIDKYAGASHLIDEMDLIKGGESKADTEFHEPPMDQLDSEQVFDIVESMPCMKTCSKLSKDEQYACSQTEIMKSISKNVKYPKMAIESGMEGTVFVKFIVNKEGNVEGVKVMRGVHKVLDQQAISAVKKLPQFIPGTQKGKPVNVSFTVPVKFKLT